MRKKKPVLIEVPKSCMALLNKNSQAEDGSLASSTYHSFRQTAPLATTWFLQSCLCLITFQLSPDEGPCPCFSRSRRRRTFPHKSLQQTHRHPESRGLRQSRGISLEPPRGLRPQPRAEALGRVDQMQSVRWDEVGEPTNHEASQGCQ